VSDELPAEPAGAEATPLFLVKGDASPEEVAALTVVLQGIAAAAAPADEPEATPEWSAHHRKLRRSYPSGPGGWRSSALPR
jgi:hypothetical protein